jgi:hypothetical protein
LRPPGSVLKTRFTTRAQTGYADLGAMKFWLNPVGDSVGKQKIAPSDNILSSCKERKTTMTPNIQEKIFSGLHISKKQMLDGMALLLAKRQLSEHSMEVDYYEKKYGKNFQEFDSDFRSGKASYDMENDWMSWKFAAETLAYWENILEKTQK